MVEVQTQGFLRFPKFPRDLLRIGVVEVHFFAMPLRGSAWSRCKNSRFFAISAVLAQPSAGIGVVEVQKIEVFWNWFSGQNRRVAGSTPP